MIDHLVAEYAGGTTAAEIGQRYGLAKSSILRCPTGRRVRHPRLSASETAQLVAVYEGWAAAEGDCPTAWQEPKCRLALSAAVGESVNNAR